MITSDISDNGSGDFLACTSDSGLAGQDCSLLPTLMKHLLDTDTDPWTMIGWPLLGLGEQREAYRWVRERRSGQIALLLSWRRTRRANSSLRLCESLRARYDQLATYEESFGAKLTTLRRLLLFGAFALHVHMIRRYGDVVDEGQQPPILLDLFDGRRRSLREASAATLQNGFRAIEQLVLHRIREHLDEVCGAKPEKYLRYPARGQGERGAAGRVRRPSAGGRCDSPRLPKRSGRSGYSGVGPGEVKGLPWNALLALGRRSGYLLPYDNRGRGGKEHKRYGVNAEFAEVLVAATVVPGDPLDFDDFLEILRNSFGIVVGRTADFEVIRRNDLRPGAEIGRSVSVNEGDLRANLTGVPRPHRRHRVRKVLRGRPDRRHD